jgi:hypothetical protein
LRLRRIVRRIKRNAMMREQRIEFPFDAAYAAWDDLM